MTEKCRQKVLVMKGEEQNGTRKENGGSAKFKGVQNRSLSLAEQGNKLQRKE